MKISPLEFPLEATDRVDDRQSARIRPDAPFLKDVKVRLEARLGSTEMSMQELFALKNGSVVPLNSELGGEVELVLNGSVVAYCEIVAAGEHFGARIVSIPDPQ